MQANPFQPTEAQGAEVTALLRVILRGGEGSPPADHLLHLATGVNGDSLLRWLVDGATRHPWARLRVGQMIATHLAGGPNESRSIPPALQDWLRAQMLQPAASAFDHKCPPRLERDIRFWWVYRVLRDALNFRKGKAKEWIAERAFCGFGTVDNILRRTRREIAAAKRGKSANLPRLPATHPAFD